MGCRSFSFISVIVSLFFSSVAHNNSDQISLDALLQQYAYKALVRPHTGILYKATLPANFSGMEASVIRLRSRSFWNRGSNVSSIWFPSRIISRPFAKRISIVYQNLGKWSSHYYNVPNYSLVTPVVGFRIYDSSNLSSKSVRSLSFKVTGDPISLHFPDLKLPSGSNLTVRCVTFKVDGSVSLSNMTLPNVCFTRDQGHFSVAVEQSKTKTEETKKGRSPWRLWKWLVIGFVCVLVGLILIGVVVKLVASRIRTKKIRKMEQKADQGEGFNTIWIGSSKMPSAAVTRTHPTLETGYAP